MTLALTLFGQGSHPITAGQECARAVLILAYGLMLVRIAGRRVFGKWSALDIVVSIMIGSNLSRALTGSAPLWGTLAATTLLMLLHFVLSWVAARWPWASRLIEGRAIELASSGRVAHDRRVYHTISAADIQEALRQKGVERVEDTARIVLEPSGAISVLR